MAAPQVPITRATWSRCRRSLIEFGNSEVGWRARALFALLITLLLAFNGLNVLNSYVGRDFITAISNRDSAGFTRDRDLRDFGVRGFSGVGLMAGPPAWRERTRPRGRPGRAAAAPSPRSCREAA